MLNANMEALLNDAPSDLLIDDDTYCALGNVPNLAGASVIVTVRHTLVDSTIGNNVYVVADLVGGEVG